MFRPKIPLQRYLMPKAPFIPADTLSLEEVQLRSAVAALIPEPVENPTLKGMQFVLPNVEWCCQHQAQHWP